MITVNQIRALAREALTGAQHTDCDVALGRREMFIIRDSHIEKWRPTARDRRAACSRLTKLYREKAVRS